MLLNKVGQDPISVENLVYEGTPDVNYVEGWIELKVLKQWPKRETTAIRIPHFTKTQRIWLRRRWKKGGQVHFLLVIGKNWILFDGETAADHVGFEDRKKLEVLAVTTWDGQPSAEELLKGLRWRSKD